MNIYEQFINSSLTVMDKDMDKDKDKDKDSVIPAVNPLFVEFWTVYPARNGKKINRKITERLFNGLSKFNQSIAVTAAGIYATSGQIAKDPERFLRNEYYKEWITPTTGVITNGNSTSTNTRHNAKHINPIPDSAGARDIPV
jgi:hypothetical protein